MDAMKVLIADGSASGSTRLANMLAGSLEIEILEYTTDAIKTMEMVRSLKPDAIVMDIEMPGTSGISLLRQIKRAQPNVKVIVLTNAYHPQYRERCLKEGADYFLNKAREFSKVPELLRRVN